MDSVKKWRHRRQLGTQRARIVDSVVLVVLYHSDMPLPTTASGVWVSLKQRWIPPPKPNPRTRGGVWHPPDVVSFHLI